MHSPGAADALYRQYDWSEIQPSTAVMDAVAAYDASHHDAADAPADPLYAYVDPDAVDALVCSDGHATVGFRLGDYHILIQDTTITVTTHSPHSPHSLS